MIAGDLLLAAAPSARLHIPSIRLKKLSLPFYRSLHRPRLRRLNILLFRSNPKFQVRMVGRCCSGRLEVLVDEIGEVGELDSLVEISETRTLPSALSLGEGVDKIRKEVEKLKANPPSARSGVLRLQVAVPPSTKALNWLCFQQKSSIAFPQFYLSREQIADLSHGMDSLSPMLGVSGIGAAIYFQGYSCTQRKYDLVGRYLSDVSPLVRVYGVIPSQKKRCCDEKTESFCFFIPQIELDEAASYSLVASTVVWDACLSYTFAEAVNSLELQLNQIVNEVAPFSKYSEDVWFSRICGSSDVKDVKDLEMVCLTTESLAQSIVRAGYLQQGDPSCSDRVIMRLSQTMSIGTPAFTSYGETRTSIMGCANINYVWALLIVEECVRLGLTYFCIAPGSRSSPLAVSASRHSCTTCISCFDERSLAFHAVGYARGSGRPAVVITSSGTAVSNLLPAVVEASHAFVPLMLLTADRPPELHDTGANQTINQVNHFGKFVRFFFSLPPPSELVPARMVLTTIDSAVYSATQAPYGPVHVNCPFREPLEDQLRAWSLDCLKGLNMWISGAEPFTKYIKMQYSCGCNGRGQILEVIQAIHSATNGLLLFGHMQLEDDIWASLLLAKHLSWPIVTDVLSGLRLRRQSESFPDIEDYFLFVDNLDHALLSESMKNWAKPDVIVQIGNRITSKRICQMLESCSFSLYILVDRHPNRHDPSHIVTHRIQSSILEFVDVLIRGDFQRKSRRWGTLLKEIDIVVCNEISFQIQSESSLTEPHVAQVITKHLQGGDALFIGNSMAIRDVDMYGCGSGESHHDNLKQISNLELLFTSIQVSGNRGASGIDGLLSTAIGFAVGSNKRVLCMIGDVSLLHDTNGLAILSQSIRRKPMTIIVINNHGGAIFSLLPIANATDPGLLHRYFYSSHNVLIGKLCEAHGVKHLHARTKRELQHALWSSLAEQSDCLIEVESCIERNANFHSILRKASSAAVDQAWNVLSQFGSFDHIHDASSICKIEKTEYSVYRIELHAPPTSSVLENDGSSFHRDGILLSVTLDDGSLGYGEVAPIEIHKEDIVDVEEQLKFLLPIIERSEISCLFPLLKGSISCWIWRSLGIPPSSIFPSVRCGLEMAILNALAARRGCGLSDVLSGSKGLSLDTVQLVSSGDITMKRFPRIQVSALVDCKGTAKEVAQVVSQLVAEGFSTIKLKVARRESPTEDVIVIQEIRQMVGYQIHIRADANRKWTYEEASQFASLVKDFNLEYIEEPVCLENDIIKFCQESGVPVALDETIDNIEGNIFDELAKFEHSGIVAVVIKPSVVGGFENAAMIARWAQQHGKKAIISGAFESSLSLAAYIQFAYFLEQQNAAICSIRNRDCGVAISHGLGTYRWLKKDVTNKPLKICVHPQGDTVEACVEDAKLFLHHFQINHEILDRVYQAEQVRSYHLVVTSKEISCSIKLQEAGISTYNKEVIFLHGFLGTSQDWIPIMKSLSATTRCISIDLPGHGKSKFQQDTSGRSQQGSCDSVELVADILHKLICEVTSGGVILVGYSMGARIALYMALKYHKKIDGAVIISGSPGLKDEAAKRVRASQDDARAQHMLSCGLQCFLETWYAGNLWKSYLNVRPINSLRGHPHFRQIMASRAKHDDVQALAKSLCGLSIGRQMSLWEELRHCRIALLLIVGEMDSKFRGINQQMQHEINSSNGEDGKGGELCDLIVVPNSGHAVHLENPLPVINAVRKFITRLE